ncbi:MAG: efflux RND transporter periplasmic adaptor subunit [Thermoguttaceae bacterium]|jgi:multidrug efflux pump subunit AcrA (membrane-fusion protein)
MANSTFWRKFFLVFKVVEVRLRFIAILLITALAIGYWDTIANYWDKWTRSAPAEISKLAKDEEFYCPMHPQVVRDDFDPNGQAPHCPICGMPLSLRKKGTPPVLPPGVTGRVQLSPERIELSGIETVTIGYQPLVKQTVTAGNVAYDQTRLSRITSRVNGYVEKLYVDKTYIAVKKDEPLAEIYSPELYASSQELLLAAGRGMNSELVAPARQRLKLLGVADEEIDAMIAAGKASPRLVIRSPRAGQVIGKDIVAGSHVDEGMTLLDIADLTTVWIEADVYEKDIDYIRLGQAIRATVEALPNRVFQGELSAIYSQLDPGTRTVRVRFKVDNASGELRPGMFATVRIDTPLDQIEPFKSGPILAVPERAVIDTGTRQIVYIQREPGLFEGVEVQLGLRIGEFYPVLKGLKPGEKVAAAGAFLIDAETRLNPSAGTYFGASGGPTSSAARDVIPQTQPASNTQKPTDAAKTSAMKQTPPPNDGEIPENVKANLAKLPPEDQKPAAEQKFCPITGALLGSMGVPVKITLKGQAVFLCCPGCVGEAKKDPEKTLQKIAELKNK